MKIISGIIKILILLVFLVLALSNTQTVQFFYLPAQPLELPLIVVLFGAFVIGHAVADEIDGDVRVDVPERL